MTIMFLIAGLLLLTVGAELLVRGAAALARLLGLTPLVIGLTVVAFGTSAPELAVSLKAALAAQPDIALGNVLGSNTFNILFILGLSALIVPLAVSAQLVRFDVPLLIAVSALTWLLAADGRFSRLEGAAFLLAILAYTAGLIYFARRKNRTSPQSTSHAPDTSPRLNPLLAALLVLAGLILLVLGARLLVNGAIDLARSLGVSELMISLTIVAAGTSMPELATSVVAAIRGQRDIAVGNIVGSNLFNLLAVLGAAAAFSPNGVNVAPQALSFDLPVTTAVALACLPIFFTAGRVARSEGALFVAYYIAYVIFLILAATKHPSLTAFSHAILYFAIPLSLLGLSLSVLYHLRNKKTA